MIQISKDEARIVRKYFPKLHMRRTANKYYAEESTALLKLLSRGGERKDVKCDC